MSISFIYCIGPLHLLISWNVLIRRLVNNMTWISGRHTFHCPILSLGETYTLSTLLYKPDCKWFQNNLKLVEFVRYLLIQMLQFTYFLCIKFWLLKYWLCMQSISCLHNPYHLHLTLVLKPMWPSCREIFLQVECQNIDMVNKEIKVDY